MALQSPVCAEMMAMTAGTAAARIIRHGIAAHTSSIATLCRKAVGAAAVARRVLQIEANIAANTPAETSAHIPITMSRIGYGLAGRSERR
jgi:hypothetical protein